MYQKLLSLAFAGLASVSAANAAQINVDELANKVEPDVIKWRQFLKSAGKNKVIIDVSVLFIHIFDALLTFTDRAPRVEVAE